MYSTALIKRRNEEMKVKKDLKRNEPNIPAYVKSPAQLMFKREKDKEYSLYAEYQFSLLFKPKAVYVWSFSEEVTTLRSTKSCSL